MIRQVFLSIVLVGLAGCRTVDPDPEPAPRDLGVRPVAWTEAFLEPAVLIGDEITVEGPPGLLQHVAIRQDAEFYEFVAKTTKDGLRQEYVLKPGVQGIEIRGQIDAWVLAALRRLTVLERPGPGPVLVRASGSAAWIPADGVGERREASLVFRGESPR